MTPIARFWHWLTTSPYTRLLESELDRARAENEALKHDNEALMLQMYPKLAEARRALDKTESKHPASFNFSQR